MLYFIVYDNDTNGEEGWDASVKCEKKIMCKVMCMQLFTFKNFISMKCIEMYAYTCKHSIAKSICVSK